MLPKDYLNLCHIFYYNFYTPEGSYYGMGSVRPLANSCADNSSFIVLLNFFKLAWMDDIDV